MIDGDSTGSNKIEIKWHLFIFTSVPGDTRWYHGDGTNIVPLTRSQGHLHAFAG